MVYPCVSNDTGIFRFTSAKCRLPQLRRKVFSNDELFAKMTATYEQGQKDLSARVIVLRDTIAKAKTQRLNIDSFLTQVKKYTEVKELDAEIIRSLVERIDVFTPEKVPGTRTKKQTILIHWNFIGTVELPQEQKKSA